MKLTTTMLFNNRDFEVSIVIYEEEQVVTIYFGEEDYHFTFKEFNQFVTMLEKIKPVKL